MISVHVQGSWRIVTVNPGVVLITSLFCSTKDNLAFASPALLHPLCLERSMVGPRVKVLSRGGACSRKEAVRFVRRVSSRGWVGGEEVRIEEKGFGAAVGLECGVLINQFSGNKKKKP